MGLDPKLRDVLDFLPCEPCLQRPSPDQEALCTICHRLNRTVALKCQVSLVARDSVGAPTTEEMMAAAAEARRRQLDYERLASSQQSMSELAAERDALLARQHELEQRLARLEATSRGGALTFVDEGPIEAPEPVVEFHRVDLGAAPGELMEFEAVGTENLSAFDEPDGDAWGTPSAAEPAGAPAWDEWGSEPAAGQRPSEVAWDEEEPAAGWEAPRTPRGFEEPADEEAPARAHEAPAWERGEATQAPEKPATEEAWSGERSWAETEWAASETGETPAEPAPSASAGDLDARTRADLAELERQLAELERELASRQKKDLPR